MPLLNMCNGFHSLGPVQLDLPLSLLQLPSTRPAEPQRAQATAARVARCTDHRVLNRALHRSAPLGGTQ